MRADCVTHVQVPVFLGVRDGHSKSLLAKQAIMPSTPLALPVSKVLRVSWRCHGMDNIEAKQKGRYFVAARLRAREEVVKLPLLLVRIVLSYTDRCKRPYHPLR